MKLFAIKTICHWTVEKRSTSMIEERVIAFKSKNLESAIKKAKKNLIDYCSGSFKNPFQLKVQIIPIFRFEDYEITEKLEIKDGTEIFSRNKNCFKENL